jgi:hypothetical protein
MRGGAEMGGTGGMNVSYLGETILMITDRRGGEKLRFNSSVLGLNLLLSGVSGPES